MKRKIRIFSHIAIIALSVCMFAFGVYAASTVSVTTSGTVSFNATGVYAKVTGAISGINETVTYDELTFDSNGVSGDASTWSNNVSFDTGNEITLTITVQNLATDRPIYVNLYDKTNGEKLNKIITVGESSYLSATIMKINASSNIVFIIKMTPKELNSSFSVGYEYLLDIDSTNVNADTLESKLQFGTNNDSMGEIEYTLNGNDLTLSATAKDGYHFLGFTVGSATSGEFIFAKDDYLIEDCATSTTLNLRLTDHRSFYAIFYSSIQYDDPDQYEYPVRLYLGSNYASYFCYNVSNMSDIPTTYTYDNKEYIITLFVPDDMMGGPFNSELNNFTIENFSTIPLELGLSRYTNIVNLRLSASVKYINDWLWLNDFTYHNGNEFSLYIDSKELIQYFTETNLDDGGHLGALSEYDYNKSKLYINEKIIDYLHVNSWFIENYTKSATPTTYEGETYYFYEFNGRD